MTLPPFDPLSLSRTGLFPSIFAILSSCRPLSVIVLSDLNPFEFTVVVILSRKTDSFSPDVTC